MRIIVYKDILPRLAAIGWTAYKLRNKKVFSESTMANLRNGNDITTKTINKLCGLLNCSISDLMEYVPDEEQGN